MAVLTKLRDLFGGKKKSEDQQYWEGWDKRVTDLENKLNVSQNVRLVTGGLPDFETRCTELNESLNNMLEGERRARAQKMLSRIELALKAARVMRDEPEASQRQKLWVDFLRALKEHRNVIHYKTRVKYDRLRLDYESGKLK